MAHISRRNLRGAAAIATTVVVGLAWGANIVSAGKQPAPSEALETRKILRVAVDIGHSRLRAGATSARGRPEFAFNQRLATELVAASKAGEPAATLDLFLVNPDERKLSLKDRVREAERMRADIFLSIHHDAVNEKYIAKWTHDGAEKRYSDAFRGFSVFVSSENPEFEASLGLATSIGRALKASGLVRTLHHAEPIKGEGRDLLDWEYGVYDAPFAVLRHARIPSVLFEAGVIVHREEEARLETRAYRKRIIGGLLTALATFRKDRGKVE